MLDEGRIVAIGTPDEIRRSPDSRGQHFLTASISHELESWVHLPIRSKVSDF